MSINYLLKIFQEDLFKIKKTYLKFIRECVSSIVSEEIKQKYVQGAFNPVKQITN